MADSWGDRSKAPGQPVELPPPVPTIPPGSVPSVPSSAAAHQESVTQVPTDVSVIIAAYNGRDTLAAQLAALAAQDPPLRWEVVIADNGSTDDTLHIAELYRDRLPKLTVVSATGRRGPSHARNVGASVATSPLLIFVDQDDVVAPGYLEAMVDALGSAELVGARIDHDALNAGWSGDIRGHWQSDGLLTGMYLPAASGCSLGVRRNAFERVGGFDADFASAQDLDFCWRVQEGSQPMAFVPDAVLRYRWRPGLFAHFQQERRWGQDDALLFSRYRTHGMPRSLASSLRQWPRLLKHLILARSRADFAWCAGALGRLVGRLEGSWRYRVFYP
jgi:glycosyltransferase involved in cell wall biosynthesis